jgi:hypothetical protein
MGHYADKLHTMETYEWAALPQRERRRDRIVAHESDSSKMGTIKSEGCLDTDGRPDVQHNQQIFDNIKERSTLQRANATLESRDGCAGEFYECTVSYCNFLC